MILTPGAYCFEDTEESQSTGDDSSVEVQDSGTDDSARSTDEDTEASSESEEDADTQDQDLEIESVETESTSGSSDVTYYMDDALNLLNPSIETEQDYYDTSLFTGSFVYTYPIETVRGIGGLKPEVSLTYSSSRGSEGTYGILGSGWSLNENCIVRDVRYTPENISDDRFIFILGGSTYKLVYVVEEGAYHTETESFMNITRDTTNTNSFGEYWTVKSTDGTVYRFGYNDASEQRNSVESRNYVSKWWLDLIEDVHGNRVYYNYVENPASGETGSTYLENITYNDNLSVVEFGFGEKPDNFVLYLTFRR